MADQYSTADFIAISDSDVVFTTFGIPQLLFQPAEGQSPSNSSGVQLLYPSQWKTCYSMCICLYKEILHISDHTCSCCMNISPGPTGRWVEPTSGFYPRWDSPCDLGTCGQRAVSQYRCCPESPMGSGSQSSNVVVFVKQTWLETILIHD